MEQNRMIEHLYLQHRKSLYKFIFKYVHNQHTAEELLHDTYIKLIEYGNKYTLQNINLKSLLFTIGKQLSLNYIKRNNKFDFIPVESFEQSHHHVNIQTPPEPINLEDELAPIMNNLSPMFQTLFIMKFIKKLKNNEISQCQGVSERTIRRRMKQLKEYFMDSQSDSFPQKIS